MLQAYELTWSEIASIVAIILSSWAIIRGFLQWRNKKPILFHEIYRSESQKSLRFKKVRLIIWNKDGKAIVEDEDINLEIEEDYTPALIFTLLNRSAEPIEIYEIKFNHLSTNREHPYFQLKPSVRLPYLLKPHDYQRFQITFTKEHSSGFLYTWQNRKILYAFLPEHTLSTSRRVEVRTSKGTIKAYIRGFSRLENTRRKLVKYWLFSRNLNRFNKNPNVIKAPSFLSKENWWK